jgi:hypothetical protein
LATKQANQEGVEINEYQDAENWWRLLHHSQWSKGDSNEATNLKEQKAQHLHSLPARRKETQVKKRSMFMVYAVNEMLLKANRGEKVAFVTRTNKRLVLNRYPELKHKNITIVVDSGRGGR